MWGARVHAVCLSAALLVSVGVLAGSADAQTFAVIHNFAGNGDGAVPYVGLTLDGAGNLYGATLYGGLANGCYGTGCGVIFKMSLRNSSWIFSPLYTFTGAGDGAFPDARVVFGPNGALYGSTITGGNGDYQFGTGVIFSLQPPPHASGRFSDPWLETPLYRFGNVNDGNYPTGNLVFDAVGNIYGTTQNGGYECEDTVYCGTVFELARNGSNWNESILHEFTDSNTAIPLSGVVFDATGNLLGTTSEGLGAVFELTYSGSTWTETTVHYFQGQGDGYGPAGGLVPDASGNFYGATASGGANGMGALYKLQRVGGSWQVLPVYGLTATGPDWTLARDAAGNFYGTTCEGGSHNSGSVFKLAPAGGSWVETLLYQFTGGTDGYCPLSGVTVDAAGNLYGSAWAGGSHGSGVVWEITP